MMRAWGRAAPERAAGGACWSSLEPWAPWTRSPKALNAALRLLSASIRKFAFTTTLSPLSTPAAYFGIPVGVGAQLHRSRLVPAFSKINQHHLSRAGMKDGRVGHGEDFFPRRRRKRSPLFRTSQA